MGFAWSSSVIMASTTLPYFYELIIQTFDPGIFSTSVGSLLVVLLHNQVIPCFFKHQVHSAPFHISLSTPVPSPIFLHYQIDTSPVRKVLISIYNIAKSKHNLNEMSLFSTDPHLFTWLVLDLSHFDFVGVVNGTNDTILQPLMPLDMSRCCHAWVFCYYKRKEVGHLDGDPIRRKNSVDYILIQYYHLKEDFSIPLLPESRHSELALCHSSLTGDTLGLKPTLNHKTACFCMLLNMPSGTCSFNAYSQPKYVSADISSVLILEDAPVCETFSSRSTQTDILVQGQVFDRENTNEFLQLRPSATEKKVAHKKNPHSKVRDRENEQNGTSLHGPLLTHNESSVSFQASTIIFRAPLALLNACSCFNIGQEFERVVGFVKACSVISRGLYLKGPPLVLKTRDPHRVELPHHDFNEIEDASDTNLLWMKTLGYVNWDMTHVASLCELNPLHLTKSMVTLIQYSVKCLGQRNWNMENLNHSYFAGSVWNWCSLYGLHPLGLGNSLLTWILLIAWNSLIFSSLRTRMFSRGW